MMNTFSFYVLFLSLFLTQEVVALSYNEANDHDVRPTNRQIPSKGDKDCVAKKINNQPLFRRKYFTRRQAHLTQKKAIFSVVFIKKKISVPVSVIKVAHPLPRKRIGARRPHVVIPEEQETSRRTRLRHGR
jgi:hypothetical protein